MRRLLPLSTVALLALAAGCSGVRELSSPSRPLSASESQTVRAKSDELKAQKKWTDAWDQEVQAGADRGRLEGIALASLEADDGPFEDMLEQLRKKFGGLTDGGKAKVREIATAAEGKSDWKRAADVWIATADDAPEYKAAFDLYARATGTNVKYAPDVLKRIQNAREAYDEAHAKPRK